jgi:hypothetical protein
VPLWRWPRSYYGRSAKALLIFQKKKSKKNTERWPHSLEAVGILTHTPSLRGY